jgi:hypothetical protein
MTSVSVLYFPKLYIKHLPPKNGMDSGGRKISGWRLVKRLAAQEW